MKSSTLIELAVQLYASGRGKDYDTFRSLCDPEIEWRQNPGFPGGGINRGADAVIQNVYGAFAKRWQSFGFVPKAMWESGDTVFVTGEYVGTALGTGKQVVAETCHQLRFNGEKVSHFQQYTDTKVLWDALTPDPA